MSKIEPRANTNVFKTPVSMRPILPILHNDGLVVDARIVMVSSQNLAAAQTCRSRMPKTLSTHGIRRDAPQYPLDLCG